MSQKITWQVSKDQNKKKTKMGRKEHKSVMSCLHPWLDTCQGVGDIVLRKGNRPKSLAKGQ